MGFKLRREVRDHLPPGLLTANERSVVLELADYCNDDTRTGRPGAEWLAQAADVPASKVGDILARVGKKWTELRVPLGVGKDGRPFYSRTGQRTEYRFPAIADASQVPQNGVPQNGVPQAPRFGGPQAPRFGVPQVPQNGGPPTLGRSPKTGGPSPQLPQRDPSSLSSSDERDDTTSTAHPVDAYRAVADGGVTDRHEADRIIVVAEKIHDVRTPHAWWTTIAAKGDGPTVVAEVLAEIADPGRRARRAPARPAGYEPFRNLPDQAYLDWVAGGTPDHEQEPAA